jgi:hypothetical protein
MRDNDFGVEPHGDARHSTIRGSGWTPERHQAPQPTAPAAAGAAPSDRGVSRRTGLFRVGLAGVLGIVIVVATVLAASNAQSLFTPTHYIVAGNGMRFDARVLNLRARSSAELILSIGACLSVDAVAAFGLFRLWRRRRASVPPPLPSGHRAPDAVPAMDEKVRRAPRSMHRWTVLTLLAVVIVTSLAAIPMAVSIGSKYVTLTYFSLTPVLVGAIVVFVQVWRRQNRLHTGDVRGGRLWSHDKNGNVLPALPLELHGRLKTSIAEGDRVEVRGWWNERRKVFVVESAHNLTTHLRVKRASLLKWLVVPGVLLLILGQFMQVGPFLVAGPHASTGLTFIYRVGSIVFLVYAVSVIRSHHLAR